MKMLDTLSASLTAPESWSPTLPKPESFVPWLPMPVVMVSKLLKPMFRKPPELTKTSPPTSPAQLAKPSQAVAAPSIGEEPGPVNIK